MREGFFKNFDWIILILVLLISSYSLLLIFSVSVGVRVAADLFLKQAFFILVGLLFYLLITRIDYKNLKNFALPLYVVFLGLLIFTFFLGAVTRGSIRWIDFAGLRFSPSEFLKPALILVLASVFSTARIRFKEVIIALALFLPGAYLIFSQPDIGTLITLIFIFVSILFVAGINLRYFVSLALITLVSLPLLWNYLLPYQKLRLTTFLNPGSDPTGAGYNLIQSVIAVGSGQLFGRGFGKGTQSHLAFLPEVHTDFIFSTLSEDLGFLGAVLLLSLLLILIFKIFTIAKNTTDSFGALICIGAGALILFQTFVNVGGNIGLLPITGITLPLFSYGGSSLISIMITLGLVSSVAKRSKT
ncbi:MAG: rod shape-determining protein RodA [Candidatus Woykebacteria bacterium RBG_13_40_7b]|uniref:Rod shape-determining protein RodA n=1 Tax=Candidatus Woykebacteria bacterium RBG_13_40_7b TaxID=1802594 RepID=A0A1G1WB32_9BACT|nr:MAG: rod shape-determining protein RodA [Candidatus Woykebacteria bacterium RBG_13_40_7b]